MARTDADMVKGVLLDDYGKRVDGTDPSLTRAITAANLVVNRVATCATENDYTLSTEELLEIETWLAAHYYTRSDKAFASKSTEGASASYQGQTGKGLEASFYGQTAMELDPSGCLSAIAKRQVVGGFWAGTPPSEQTPYSQRD